VRACATIRPRDHGHGRGQASPGRSQIIGLLSPTGL
jgi:hypothetical protein